jgi:hypothetical protein
VHRRRRHNLLGPAYKGWNPLFLFYPYALMGW